MRVNDTLPEVGTVFDWDIEEILSRPSVDVSDVEDWIERLEGKRRDYNYTDVKRSIKRHGFVRPLTAFIFKGYNGQKAELRFCDGHHRLAAAIELGMTTVPVEVHTQWAIAHDSGSWHSKVGIARARTVVYD